MSAISLGLPFEMPTGKPDLHTVSETVSRVESLVPAAHGPRQQGANAPS